MGFARKEYWSVFPCPLSGDLPDLGTKAMPLKSPALAEGFFYFLIYFFTEEFIYRAAMEKQT